MAASSWLEIDLGRLDANVVAFRAILKRPEPGGRDPMLCAVVKADAYGLGATVIAARLAARGVDMLGVFNIEQAHELARCAIDKPILILAPLRQLERTDPLYRTAVTGRLHLALHDEPQLDQLSQIGRSLGCVLPLHLYLDTGMSRSGFTPDQLPRVLGRLKELQHVKLAGIYTHPATADTSVNFLATQYQRFDAALAENRQLIDANVVIHAANTFATLRDRCCHRDMVRVGLGLWGYGTDLLQGPRVIDPPARLQPIVRWQSRVNHVQHFRRASTVGYGSTCRLRRDSRLGVVPVGYADGYPLSLSRKAQVVLPEFLDRGKPAKASVLGAVNMDQIVIDLTDVGGAGVDTLVELISPESDSPCYLPKLAKLAGSHCYEMLTGIGPGVKRKYVGGEG